jgi:hypothetical protein
MPKEVNNMKDTINDCFVDVYNRRPFAIEIEHIQKHMPKEIKILAEQWGWNDTEVRDKIYRFIKETE